MISHPAASSFVLSSALLSRFFLWFYFAILLLFVVLFSSVLLPTKCFPLLKPLVFSGNVLRTEDGKVGGQPGATILV